MSIDITTYRKGTRNPHYDDNGRQIDSKFWEEIHTFKCVEHAMYYNSHKNNNLILNDTEQQKQYKLFYIELFNQKQNMNLDIKLGDYIKELNLGGYWWKILSLSQQEILNDCWVIILRAERLTGREVDRVLVREESTDNNTMTGR